MKSLIFILSLVSINAFAADVKTCDQAQIGLSVLTAPLEKTSRALSRGGVLVFNTDTSGEPVSCSRGLAITVVRKDEPGTECFYIGCFASISPVSEAKVSYDATKGLLVEVKTGDYGPNGPREPTKSLKIRINQADYTVKIE